MGVLLYYETLLTRRLYPGVTGRRPGRSYAGEVELETNGGATVLLSAEHHCPSNSAARLLIARHARLLVGGRRPALLYPAIAGHCPKRLGLGINDPGGLAAGRNGPRGRRG